MHITSDMSSKVSGYLKHASSLVESLKKMKNKTW